MSGAAVAITDLIAAQNDVFRNSLINGLAVVSAAQQGIKGRVLLTQGVSNEGAEFQSLALQAVAEFDAFTQDIDPYGDHTFAAVTVQGKQLFWKIDLYDLAFEYGSETPEDPTKTQRVLTIMFPSEY